MKAYCVEIFFVDQISFQKETEKTNYFGFISSGGFITNSESRSRTIDDAKEFASIAEADEHLKAISSGWFRVTVVKFHEKIKS